MYLTERWEGVIWIRLAQDNGSWCPVVNTVTLCRASCLPRKALEVNMAVIGPRSECRLVSNTEQ
jgi:methylphosphotriester-DNA--protein-cysteine methyltransferase